MTTATEPVTDLAMVDESRTYEIWPSITRTDGYTGPTVTLATTEPEDQS